MNKTFKLVFNRARGKMMVVNEMTRSAQKSSKTTATIVAAGLMLALPAAQASLNNPALDGIISGLESLQNESIVKDKSHEVVGLHHNKKVEGNLSIDLNSKKDNATGIEDANRVVVDKDLTIDVHAKKDASGIEDTDKVKVGGDLILDIRSDKLDAEGIEDVDRLKVAGDLKLEATAKDEAEGIDSSNVRVDQNMSIHLESTHDDAEGIDDGSDVFVGKNLTIFAKGKNEAEGIEDSTVKVLGNLDIEVESTGRDYDDEARGICDGANVTVHNNLNILAIAKDDAYGIDDAEKVTVDGNVRIEAHAIKNSDSYAYGISYSNLNVGRNLFVEVEGVDSAYGIEDSSVEVGNDLNIIAKANNNDAYGIYYSDTVTAEGNVRIEAYAFEGQEYDAEAYGIYESDLNVGKNLFIKADASDYAYGIYYSDTVTAEGNVRIETYALEGQDDDASAYGIYESDLNVGKNLFIKADAADYANGINSSSVNVNGDTFIKITATGDACGIYGDQNTLHFNDNLYIQANGKNDQRSWAIWDDGDSVIVLKGQNNYLGGNVELSSTSQLKIRGMNPNFRSNTLIDGNLTNWSPDRENVKWKLQQPIVKLENANLNVTGRIDIDDLKMKDSNLQINKYAYLRNLDAKDSTIERQSIKHRLIIDNLDKKGTLTLAGSGAVNDETGGNVEKLFNRLKVEGEKITLKNYTEYFDEQLVLREGEIMGEVTGTLDKAGNLVTHVAANERNQAKANAVANVAATVSRVQMNELRKRLGDVRTAEGTDGAWARYTGGAMSGDFGLDTDFHMIQAGYDRALGEGMPRVGAAFSYAKTESDDNFGSADSDSWTLAGYGVWNWDNGMFVDTIARFGKVDTDLEQLGNKADIDSWMLSLSGEFGIRQNLTETFFVEPSAELSYTWLKGDDFTMAGVNREIDDFDSLIGRFGATVGMALPQGWGDAYVRANLVHEFTGDASITSGALTPNGYISNTESVSGNDTWVEMGIGANVNVNKSTYVYADIEHTEGADIEEDWRANLGVRYSF